MHAKQEGDRLFSGIYPAGIVYADRYEEVAGDYKRLAFLPYSTMKLDLNPDCPEDLKERICADAKRLQSRIGQPFQISTSGQTIELGHALK